VRPGTTVVVTDGGLAPSARIDVLDSEEATAPPASMPEPPPAH